jgi:serine/threonine-protein kinase
VLRYARGAPDLPVRTFAAGQTVVREGEMNTEAFVVREGTCIAYKTVDGQRVVLRTMGAGEVFGELSILSSKPCTATVEALEDVSLEVVDASTLRDGVGLHTWVAPFVAALAERFREVDARLTALEHPGARESARAPERDPEPAR